MQCLLRKDASENGLRVSKSENGEMDPLIPPDPTIIAHVLHSSCEAARLEAAAIDAERGGRSDFSRFLATRGRLINNKYFRGFLEKVAVASCGLVPAKVAAPLCLNGALPPLLRLPRASCVVPWCSLTAAQRRWALWRREEAAKSLVASMTPSHDTGPARSFCAAASYRR